ncbi:MAG: hypothetical protein ACOC5F_03890 [Candidatus Aminicenantaceae bacterium]
MKNNPLCFLICFLIIFVFFSVPALMADRNNSNSIKTSRSYLKSEINRKNIAFENDEELHFNSISNDFARWKHEMDRAKGKIRTGVILEIIGVAVLAPSLANTLFLAPGSRISDTGKTLALAGTAIGGGLIIAGSISVFKGTRSKRRLEQEGRAKGYLRAGILPSKNALGIQAGFSF